MRIDKPTIADFTNADHDHSSSAQGGSSLGPLTGLTTSVDATIHGMTVGLGPGASSNNTVLGTTAFPSNTTGVGNTAVGFNAMPLSTGGNTNTAVGYQALGGPNSTGSDNQAFGIFTLQANTTGNNNSAIGRSALAGNQGGSDNLAIGTQALQSNVSGASNVGIGTSSLFSNTGSKNIAIGFQAGYGTGAGANTSGHDNVFLGYEAVGAAATDLNEIVIGANATGAGSNTATLGDTNITTTVLRGSVSATTFVGALTGNASTATALQTPRAINGVNFDGTAPITVTADANTLTNTTLHSTVTASSLTSVGTITTGVWNGTVVDVAHGGSGAATFTAHGVLIGEGTGAFAVTAVGNAGEVLTSNGVGLDPTFQTASGGLSAAQVSARVALRA